MPGDNSALSLPNNSLPECWNDESRMNVLFAPVRNRSVNPQDWDSKLTFWRNLISQCCIHSNVYTFKIDDLQRLFNKGGRFPSCLNVVIDEMYKSGDIKPVEQFLQRPAQTWHKWATDIFIKKPLLWSYCKIKDTLVSPTTDHTYVHLTAVRTEAENLLSSLSEDLKNKVVSLQDVFAALKIDASKADGIKLILHYLVCNGKADVREIETSNTKHELPLYNLLVKFGDIKQIKPITDVDVSVHILEQNEKMLTKNLEKLENEVLSTIAQAKTYLSKGHRQMAKNCLRKKHEIENRITKRANALQNVQALLIKVRDADTDSQVLDSYKLALSTLKKTFKETGLSEDMVSNTMVELGDVLDLHEDIQASLSQSLSGNDADLEDELAELIAADENQPEPPKPPSPLKPSKDAGVDDLEKRLQNLDLPEVPSKSPLIESKITL